MCIRDRNKRTRQLVAMKIMEKKFLGNPNMLKALTREIEIHKTLLHDNIIRLIEHCEDSKNIYLLMEYASKGNLFHYIRASKKLSEKEAFYFFTQACNAVYFLHKHKFMHRDIKPENMLIAETGQLKLCDFGCCARFNDKAKVTFCGTIEYMAPEVLRREHCNEKTDIWSLGILLYEMLHGRAPYQGRREKGTIKQILYSKPLFGRISEDAKEVIEALLSNDPSERPEAWEIFYFPWVKRMQDEFGIKEKSCTLSRRESFKASTMNAKSANAREPIARSLVYRQQSARNMNWLDSAHDLAYDSKDIPSQLKVQISNGDSVVKALQVNRKVGSFKELVEVKSNLFSNGANSKASPVIPTVPVVSAIDTTCESATSFYSKLADKENMLPNSKKGSFGRLKREIFALASERSNLESTIKKKQPRLHNHLKEAQTNKTALPEDKKSNKTVELAKNNETSISWMCEEEGRACVVKASGYRVSIEKVRKNSLILPYKEDAHQSNMYTVESEAYDLPEKGIKRAKSFSNRLRLRKGTRV
eukprot:TRINITY_DN4533_c0_g1_i4.p1 TRINITY_DN4533_c0_g1~~TRINITY_DN4533_c0_g1_i4.p1  ORF type:complete len:532 (-),score=128.88 TRINITY_DN4533_c0_g1_i4:99-1694(-)